MIKLRNIYLLISAILLVVTACEKDETPIKLPPRGNTSFMVIDSLGKDFEKQAFFNLKDSQITLVNSNSWDLAFEASPFGSKITLNGGMDMYAAKTSSRNFFYTNKPDTFNYKWDAPCGCFDSLAIDERYDNIYIIDRGYNYTTNRYYQLKITEITNSDYHFQFASINNPTIITAVILPKNPSKVNVYYSFSTPNTYLDFEPKKEKWDICFLKYRYVFYETSPITKYVVRGIFINPSKIIVAVDSTCSFESITPLYAQDKCKYSNIRDVIGYDWKVYNFTSGQYLARTKVNYIIKDYHTNETYKLRFLDFNNNGIKGTPKFEYLPLK